MKKGIMQVFIANTVFLIISLATNLVLPKFLTIESYASFKTFSLYLSYAGFFHFGYNDGMYLKYGGKYLKEIPPSDFGKNFYNYFLLECFVAIVFAVVGFRNNDEIIIAFGCGLLATNIIGYFRSFYQSIGEFKRYGEALSIEKAVILLIYILLIFLVKTDNAGIYIWSQVIVDFVIVIFLMIYLNKSYKYIKEISFSLKEIGININKGFILMLGNFTNSFFTGIDRWFVKILMSSANFATYSFSVAMENMLNVFVTPISVTMYNDFAKNNDIFHIKSVKRIVLLWGPFIVMLAFPCKWFLENYLTKYIQSSAIIFFLFATHMFYVVIKGIYVNYYKVFDMQKLYLKQVIYMTGVSIILNTILYCVLRSMISIAIATLLTSLIWFIDCEKRDIELRFSNKEILGLLICLISYILCGNYLSSIFGLIFYTVILIVVFITLWKDNFNMLLEKVIKSKKIKQLIK